MASVKDLLKTSLMDLGNALKEFQWHLEKDYEHISKSEMEGADIFKTVDKLVACFEPERAVKVTADILKKMNQNHMATELAKKYKLDEQTCSEMEEIKRKKLKMDQKNETADLILKTFLETHKSNMKKKAECIFEGKKENKAHLQAVYTKLFITKGDMKDVNQEREILKTDNVFMKIKTQDKCAEIECNDIFTLLRKNDEKKIVLTKGVAGIGKTVSVHKFILDWAEGKANQDIHCVFLLPFREMNLMTNEEFSLHKLLLEFYPEMKDMEKTKLYEEYRLVFIFDGLDESRLPLNFNCRPLNTVEKRSSVDVLFNSLVRGTLLPSALVWVTSRPAAANQIPKEFVGLYTEVRGFNDKQKKEYFRKRFPKETDETKMADRIISHIEKSRSLYIMCHIPVFCWITATVLQDNHIETNGENINTTVTEMYIHFLLIQMKIKNQKYDGKEERDFTKNLESNRPMILKLAKLAFEQLKQEKVVFDEKDLKACGINMSKDTEFTGMIAEIFKKVHGLHETKVFYFVHLSVQEFLAAVHVFLCYLNKNMKELQYFFDSPKENITLQQRQFFFIEPKKKCTFQQRQFFISEPEENITLPKLLEKAIDKAMGSQKGHLDLFLRFLMGITLKSSQDLLTGLIPHTEDTTESITEISEHIKQVQDKKIPDEASVNLFYCLLELKDRSLDEKIQRYLNSDEHPGRDLSSSMCSVLTYTLLMSEKILDEFNPKRFTSSQENYKRLIPAMRCCRKAIFDSCGFDERSCETVSSALQSSDCHLTDLDLSSNHLRDSGVKLLFDGLESSHCRLNLLRLFGCNLTAQFCERLSSALQSSNCRLRELDLSNNDLQDSGVKLLCDGLKSPNCQLQILRFPLCNLTAQSCGSLSSVLQLFNSCLRELDLSNNDLRDLGVKLLSDGLTINYNLKILRLSGCMVTKEGCGYLLSSNPSHLRELDLSYNYPGESGVKLLSEKLKNLDKLNMDHGEENRITAGLKKYSHQLSLDLNTVYKQLHLSENNRVITCTNNTNYPYPDHPDRFECREALCRESVCGRCYWELEWRGGVYISVSYKSISRKGAGLGCSDQSWSLLCTPFSYSFIHNNIETKLPAEPISCRRGVFNAEAEKVYLRVVGGDYDNIYRIGVFVDHRAGILSFYSVSETVSLIHAVQTTFTQPLYPEIGFYSPGSSVKLC